MSPAIRALFGLRPRTLLPRAEECKPDFLCIGAQKAGTSWLFMQLQSHPEVFLPPLKELHYLDHLFVPANRKWTNWHIQTNARKLIEQHENGLGKPDTEYLAYLKKLSTKALFTDRWYRNAFRRPRALGRLKGDVTPEYCTIPDQGIEFARAQFDALKIIYIIRNPLDRALSQLRMNASRKSPGPETDQDWLEMARGSEIKNRGDYMTYIPRWKAHFEDSDLLFLPFGRIKSDPSRLMAQVEKFLGVEPASYAKLGKKVHASVPVDIPHPAVVHLREATRPQLEFLQAEFPPEFTTDL